MPYYHNIKLPLVLCLILVSLSGYSQLTAWQAIDSLGAGINLGNTLEPPNEGDWGNTAQEHYFDDYKTAGFQTVRIPVRWYTHTSTTAPYDVEAAWMNRVEQVIDWALERDLWVVLNTHHEDEFKDDYDGHIDMYLAIWDQIIARFGSKSHKLLFEMINEPIGMAEADLNEFHTLVYNKIRAQSSTRLIVFGGDRWSNSADLVDGNIPPPSSNDPYLMAYYHSYDPWNWGETGDTWGDAGDKQTATNKFQTVVDWYNTTNVPVFLGEFGAKNYWDQNSVYEYYAHITDECIQKSIPGMAWDTDNTNFWVYKRNSRSFTELKDILVHYTPESAIDFTATEGSGQVTLNWTNRTNNGSEIIVQRRANSDGDLNYTSIATIAGSANSYTDFGVANDDYHYRIISYESDGSVHYGYPQTVTVSSQGTQCSAPSLGGDQSICGVSDINLTSGLSPTGRTFTWTKDGAAITTATGPNYTVSSAGSYMLTVTEGGCTRTDFLEITGEINSVTLQNDLYLCESSAVTIDAGSQQAGHQYSWTFAGNEISTSTIVTATMGGEYTLTISAQGCDDFVTSTSVRSDLISVLNDTLCEDGVAELEILEAGNYKWFDSSVDGNQLSTNSVFTPTVANSTIFYVEDDNADMHSIGKTTQDGDIWGGTTDYSAWGRDMDFNVHTDLTIESFDIFTNDLVDLVINITDASSGFSFQYTQNNIPNMGTTPVTIPINVFLAAGSYYIDLVGTSGRVDLQADNLGSNSLAGVIDFIGTDANTQWDIYGYFYNWVIREGRACARTPVYATIDPNHPDCIVSSITEEAEATAALYPNPVIDILHFRETSNFTLMDALGNTIMNGENSSVDLSSLNSGMYIIKIGSESYRIVKQ